MTFDQIIIGGGLAGLTAGIALQEKGQRTAIISAGQNALYFFSGTFETLQGDPQAQELLARAGLSLHQKEASWRLMAGGTFREAGLCLTDVSLFPDRKIADKALLVNFMGFHDFFSSFLADALEQYGTSCRIRFIRLPEMEHLRTSPSEMRSVHIARVLDRCWEKVVHEVRVLLKDEDVILLPQVFGLTDARLPERIREALPVPVVFAGTLPPSVPGIRTQMLLQRRYEAIGGTFLNGDAVTSAALHEGVVSSVTTRNLGSVRLFADAFLLATGGYFSKGLTSSPTAITEPLFGLDVAAVPDRNAWYAPDFFSDQPYMQFGVATTPDLRAVRNGQPFKNLYAIGSILGQTRPEFGSGAGLAVRTAMEASRHILQTDVQ